jgi:hypothetical protein
MLKALVWLWLIDKISVLTYVIKCECELGWYIQAMELDDGDQGVGDDHKR